MPKANNFFLPFKSNKVILLLTVSDVFSWGIYLVLNAIIGIYLAGKLGADTIRFVGIGTSIYFLARGTLEYAFGNLLDKLKYNFDEVEFLALGNILMGISFLFYVKINSPAHYYLLQFVFGAGTALNLVSWRKLFARYLDRRHEGAEYGIYGMTYSYSSAVFAVLAGFIANISPAYFELVIIVIGAAMILSSIFPLLIFSTSLFKEKS